MKQRCPSSRFAGVAVLRDHKLAFTRKSIKPAVASLTIGSGSCALLLTHERLSRSKNHILGGMARANTEYHQLCQSEVDSAGSGMQPLMSTDAEQLMHHGIETGARTFEEFLAELGWNHGDLNRSICHQVGAAHRKQMLDRLALSEETDYSTLAWLGNTGSVALPLTLAMSVEEDWIQENDSIGLLGIGSGINCLMIAMRWQRALIAGNAVQVNAPIHRRQAILDASAVSTQSPHSRSPMRASETRVR